VKLNPAFTDVRTRRLIGSGRTFFASLATALLWFALAASTLVFVVIVFLLAWIRGVRFRSPQFQKRDTAGKLARFGKAIQSGGNLRLSSDGCSWSTAGQDDLIAADPDIDGKRSQRREGGTGHADPTLYDFNDGVGSEAQ
jgi:hypothetical protein